MWSPKIMQWAVGLEPTAHALNYLPNETPATADLVPTWKPHK